MTTQTNSRLKILETQLSKVAGVKIEITIRGEKSFTYSYEGENKKAEESIKKYFKSTGNMNCEYDLECDYTCIYHNL